MRALDDVAAPSGQQLLVEGVPMFGPLSLAAKERLAAKLVPLDVPAGATVVRAGDVGDRFYLIDSGTVRIGLDDGEKQSGPGDYFGEIALLRDVPRTATVTVATAARLYMLERADFLAAVTGHALAGISEDAKKAGCDAFVTKPCLPEDLVKEIRKVLHMPSPANRPRRSGKYAKTIG